jgi:uncharacterized protein YndB with AHSA1/START domain
MNLYSKILNHLTSNKMENLSLVKIAVEVQAPLSLTWRSWTNPRHIVNWNYASDSWHCPKAAIDLKPGGVFNYRMAARDESEAFDFTGRIDEVKEMEKLAFTLDDGRKVQVHFQQKGNAVLVTEEFEAEQTIDVELQKSGWKAILENFKAYTESLNKLERLHFEITISAPVEKVYDTMLSAETYTRWTAPFHPGSFFRGEWKEGEKILFIGKDEEGNEGGMVSRVKKAVPYRMVILEHYGILDKGKEITEGPEVMGWAGALEEYRFEEKQGKTLLRVANDTNQEFKEYMLDTWPQALAELKSICEQK